MTARKFSGEDLAAQRAICGLTRDALAEALTDELGAPVSADDVQAWEDGREVPDIDVSLALADLLGVELRDLGRPPRIPDLPDVGALLDASEADAMDRLRREPGGGHLQILEDLRVSDAVRVALFREGSAFTVTVWTDFLGRGPSALGRATSYATEAEARAAFAVEAERARGGA